MCLRNYPKSNMKKTRKHRIARQANISYRFGGVVFGPMFRIISPLLLFVHSFFHFHRT